MRPFRTNYTLQRFRGYLKSRLRRVEFCSEFRLQAVAVRAGVRVDPIEADDGSPGWIVSCWSLTRQCSTLAEVRVLLARMRLRT